MTSHEDWLLSPASVPARHHVQRPLEVELTHLELTATRELLAWWISLHVTPGLTLFLTREAPPVTPPLPMPGGNYRPRKDPVLQDFLSLAYEAAQFWLSSGSDPKVRACIRALLDPMACQAAWPSPAQILKVEREFVRLVEFDLEKGASPLRLVRTISEKYPLTPIQAREIANPVLHELIDNPDNKWSKQRLAPLLEIEYAGDIRDGVNTQDRRLATQARTNKARSHGLISNSNTSQDQEDLTKSLIEIMAKVGRDNPVALPPEDPK